MNPANQSYQTTMRDHDYDWLTNLSAKFLFKKNKIQILGKDAGHMSGQGGKEIRVASKMILDLRLEWR